MNIFVLNSGSSSIKCSLYDFSQFKSHLLTPILKEKIEWKNTQESNSVHLEKELRSLLLGKQVDCIGHRIVHGGDRYKESIRINHSVKQTIRSTAHLAPLHNVADIAGIEALEKIFPDINQFAVFDTAFHHTLPKAASIYPGPYEWIDQGIHRFGFHGISFQYCTRTASEMINDKIEKMVICHLGSGASLCAVQNGKSVDTTMGFTPLEGLMMDTRSGTIDPGIFLYLLEKRKKTPKDLAYELYEKSGLLGLSGISSDMRDILENVSKKHPRAELALDVYLHRLVSSIGSMVASLGGLDVLVFTAGIGENASLIREEVCKRLAFLGIALGESKTAGDRVLSAPSSKVKVLLIHTQEEFEIARECWKNLSN